MGKVWEAVSSRVVMTSLMGIGLGKMKHGRPIGEALILMYQSYVFNLPL